jgi:diacylglycerol kinase family enzyme
MPFPESRLTPGSPRRRIAALLNAHAGTGHDAARAAQLRQRFEARGTSVDVRLVAKPGDLPRAIDAARASGVDAVVAGGGDGTVSAVAGALAGTGLAFGVLPLGTLNHFAKDLGLPLELEAAIDVILHGEVARVDVGEVNGRRFVNNSSLGLYPDIVRERERQQHRLGRGKWTAFAWASLAVLRRYPLLGVRLVIDGEQRRCRTPFVFIGNNAYQMQGLSIGARTRLDAGCLALYVAPLAGRWRLVHLGLRALLGRLRQARDFEATLAAEIVVESRHRRLRVATDGEVTPMVPPLRYRVLPRALCVLRPRAGRAPG